MTYLSKALMIAAALGLAACTSGDRFGAGSGADGYGAGAGANAGIVPGSANDPQSPAYFNQTIGDRVHFAVDQSTLSPEAAESLPCPCMGIEVCAHRAGVSGCHTHV